MSSPVPTRNEIIIGVIEDVPMMDTPNIAAIIDEYAQPVPQKPLQGKNGWGAAMTRYDAWLLRQ